MISLPFSYEALSKPITTSRFLNSVVVNDVKSISYDVDPTLWITHTEESLYVDTNPPTYRHRTYRISYTDWDITNNPHTEDSFGHYQSHKLLPLRLFPSSSTECHAMYWDKPDPSA